MARGSTQCEKKARGQHEVAVDNPPEPRLRLKSIRKSVRAKEKDSSVSVTHSVPRRGVTQGSSLRLASSRAILADCIFPVPVVLPSKCESSWLLFDE